MPDYQPLQRLGNGTFGEVWLCRETTLQVNRAVKLIPVANLSDPTDFYREARVMSALQHPNVVVVTDAGPWVGGGVYIAMEYLSGGNADVERTSAGFVPIRRSRDLIADALRGLDFLHTSRFIHGDVKPSNIMIGADGRGRLADFGLTQQLSAQGTAQLGRAYGMHLAPEAWQNAGLSPATDIYAAGVTLYRMVNGDALLGNVSTAEAEAGALAGTYPDRSLNQPFVTRRMQNVIKKALAVSPAGRYESAHHMRVALEQVPLKADWDYQVDPQTGEGVWAGQSDTHSASVSVSVRNQLVRIESRSAVLGKPLRRVGRHCDDLPPQRARRRIQVILQEFVEEGRFHAAPLP